MKDKLCKVENVVGKKRVKKKRKGKLAKGKSKYIYIYHLKI